MNIANLILILAVGGTMVPNMQGARLQAGSTCYSILAGDKPLGTTLQTITASREGHRPTWDIVVHQKLADGSFDMRDHFVVERSTLLPIRMDSQRGKSRTDRGWQRVTLNYTRDHVQGTKVTAVRTKAIDVPLSGLTWDGNLWGATFAALPLKEGGTYSLPSWQYDKGFGMFTVRVVGSTTVATPGGGVAAWTLDAGNDPAKPSRYLVAKTGPRELGYSAGQSSQRMGGVCK